MARKNEWAQFALRDATPHIHGAINRFKHRALRAVHYNITRDDVMQAMYHPNMHGAIDILMPQWSGSFNWSTWKRDYSNTCGYRVELSCERYVGDRYMPPLMPEHEWSGTPEAQQALCRKIGAVAEEFATVVRQWAGVRMAFDLLNDNCRTPNQLRSFWPAIIQLAEREGYVDLLTQLGSFKAYAPLSMLTLKEVEMIRDSIAVVGIAMVMPDNILPCSSPFKVELA